MAIFIFLNVSIRIMSDISEGQNQNSCLTMAAAILLTLSRDQNRKILIYRIWFMFCTLKQFKLITLYERNAYWTFTYNILHFND